MFVKWGLETALPRAARGIHLSSVALLIAIIALQIIRDADAGETPGWVVVPGALAVGWIGVRVYARARFVPLLLGLLSLALVVLPLQFLLSAPVRRILAPPAATAYEDPEARADVPVVFVVFDPRKSKATRSATGVMTSSISLSAQWDVMVRCVMLRFL